MMYLTISSFILILSMRIPVAMIMRTIATIVPTIPPRGGNPTPNPSDIDRSSRIPRTMPSTAPMSASILPMSMTDLFAMDADFRLP